MARPLTPSPLGATVHCALCWALTGVHNQATQQTDDKEWVGCDEHIEELERDGIHTILARIATRKKGVV